MKRVMAAAATSWDVVDGVTKAGMQLVKAALALAVAGVFGVIAYGFIVALFS